MCKCYLLVFFWYILPLPECASLSHMDICYGSWIITPTFILWCCSCTLFHWFALFMTPQYLFLYVFHWFGHCPLSLYETYTYVDCEHLLAYVLISPWCQLPTVLTSIFYWKCFSWYSISGQHIGNGLLRWFLLHYSCSFIFHLKLIWLVFIVFIISPQGQFAFPYSLKRENT